MFSAAAERRAAVWLRCVDEQESKHGRVVFCMEFRAGPHVAKVWHTYSDLEDMHKKLSKVLRGGMPEFPSKHTWRGSFVRSFASSRVSFVRHC
jgi:hypothetical protein